MDRVAALVLAGGRGGDFGTLTEHRTKAALPVAGYYRIIDFVLSNLCHSGIRQAGVVIQYMPASLMEHIGSGRPWEFDMADRSLKMMTPFVGVDEIRWFQGTADAIAKNINLLDLSGVDDVLVLSGEHVYRMDYRKLIAHHRATLADVTFAAVEIPIEQQHPRFGNILTRGGGRIEAFIEKPERPISPNVSMGVYCFRREVLLDMLSHYERSGAGGDFSLAGNILQPHIERINAQCWMHYAPWHYLANLREYFDFHLQLADGRIQLFESDWDVITNFSDRNLNSRVPACFSPGAEVVNSVVSSGSVIDGQVIGSVLSPGVRVAKGATVRNCLVFHDAVIGEGAVVENAILDKDVVIEAGAQVGVPVDAPAERPELGPITVLAKGQRVARGEVIPAAYPAESPVMI